MGNTITFAGEIFDREMKRYREIGPVYYLPTSFTQ